MAEWVKYVVAFLGSLCVALFTVWLSQQISNRREYKKVWKNILAETITNLKVVNEINYWAGGTLEAVKKSMVPVKSCPRLYNMAWHTAKGDVMTKGYDVAVKLDELYFDIAFVNDMIGKMEDLLWGIAGSMTNSEERKYSVLETIGEYTEERLLVKLENTRVVAEKELRQLPRKISESKREKDMGVEEK